MGCSGLTNKARLISVVGMRQTVCTERFSNVPGSAYCVEEITQ
jgi:hypothetical protein